MEVPVLGEARERAAFVDCTLVVPTLNEAPGLPSFLDALASTLPGATVLLADDDSQDGTRDVAEAWRGPLRIDVLHRRDPTDRGLTASVADAILRVKTSTLLVMDADLQHPPSAIAAMLARLEAGDDLVIGTRTEDASFSRRRRFVSRVARALARRHLRKHGGHAPSDAMSGFFGLRTDVAQRIVREHGRAFERDGYKVLMDLLLHAPPDLRVGEVGYVFGGRVAGESKLSLRHHLAFLRQLGRTGRFVAAVLDLVLSGILFKFIAVGASGVAINLGVLYGLREGFDAPLALATAAAIEMSVLWNFAWNESWTFRGRDPGTKLSRRIAQFHVASLLGMLVQLGIVLGGSFLLPGVHYVVFALLGIGLGSATNLLLNLKWTWGVPVEPDD